jgi:hypothetical protein
MNQDKATATVLTGSQIEGARLLTLRKMLQLEMRGLYRSRSPSAYVILQRMGFKGTRKQVLAQMDEVRSQLLGVSE